MSSSGPRYAASAVNDTSGGSVAWNNLSNAQGASAWASTYAICYVDKSTSNNIKFTNYGFSIPVDATINGILVEINGYRNGGAATTVVAQLVKNNVISGENKSSVDWATSPLGGSTDLWGQSWTPSDINSNDFGFATAGMSSQNGVDINISGARITVYYTESVANSYSATGTGTLILAGNSLAKESVKYSSTGSLSLGGTSLSAVPKRTFIASGSLRMQGVANTFYTSSSFTGSSNGNLTLLGTSLFKVPKRVATSSGTINLYGASGSNLNISDSNYGIKFYSSPVLVFGLTLSDYDHVSSGELRLSGDSLETSKAEHNYVSSGELRLSGNSITLLKFSHLTTGSLIISGHPPVIVELHYILNNSGLLLSNNSLVHSGYASSSGQLRLSGDSLEISKAKYNYVSSGELRLSGDSLEDYKAKYNYVSSGELRLSGDSLEAYEHNYVSSGQLRLSGDSLEISKAKYNYVSSGQLRLSGDSLEISKAKYNYVSSGELRLSGDSLDTYKAKYNYVSSGELRLSETCLFKVNYIYSIDNSENLLLSSFVSYRMSDGYRYFPDSELIISGSSLVKLNYKLSSSSLPLILSGQNNLVIKSYYSSISSGQLVLNGTSLQKYKYSYYESMSGQLVLANSSLITYRKRYILNTSGSLILSGTSLQKYFKKYSYSGNGLVLIGGQSAAIETNNYNSIASGLLLFQSTALQKYSINLSYYLYNYNLLLSGRAKNKKREVLSNYFYIENENDENEVILISTKKQNTYLKWQLKDNTVKSNFTSN